MRRLWKYSIIVGILAAIGAALFWPQNHQSLLDALKSNDISKIKSLLKSALRDLKSKDPSNAIGPNDIDFGYGRTLIHAAAMHSNTSTLEYLYQIGCEFDVPRWWDGRTPLHYAAVYNDPNVVRLLIEWGADVHRETLWGEWTPLLYSVLWSNHESARTLLEGGAVVGIQHKTDGGNGKNAMQVAIIWSDWKMVKMLIEYGGYIDPGDSYYDDYKKYEKAVNRPLEPKTELDPF